MTLMFFAGALLTAVFPDRAWANRACDDNGLLAEYLVSDISGLRSSDVAQVFIDLRVPDDVAEETVSVLREAITAFEGTRPSSEQAAEIAAGEWKGWRAKHMSREEFVSGFLDEVERRKSSVGDYAASLQASQAMRNRLDDLHGAAGGRTPPEDVLMMWLWDQTMRTPAAKAELKRLYDLPDGKWVWGRYVMGRKAALRCALEAVVAAGPAPVAVDRHLFKQPNTFVPLAEGKTVSLDDRSMAYISGLLEVHLAACPWVGTPKGLKSVVQFQQAATQRAFTNMFDMRNIVLDSVQFAHFANHGKADAEAFEKQYGCISPVAMQLARGLERTVQVAAAGGAGSLFVSTCSSTRLNAKQCACLAELGRGVDPNIENKGYDSRTTIKYIVERNPLLGVMIAMQCGIGDY
ncbi:MAG: hypothetical protein AAGA50_18010 [Pseudomonadota bacterium]